MKKGLNVFTPVQVAAIRMSLASLVTLPFGLRLLNKINRSNIVPFMVVAFIGNLIPAFLFSFAQTRVNSSLAGMLNATTPFFALIFALMFFRHKAYWKQIVGIAIGLAGAFGLVMRNGFSDMTFNAYALLIVVATCMYGYNVNQVKKFLSGFTGFEITSLAYLFVFPPSIAALIFSDPTETVANPHFTMSLIYLVILSIAGSVIAVIFMNMLIQKAGALFASSVTYVIPVFAIFWGIADGESITGVQIFSIFTVLAGVYLVNKSE